jgi:hypothetical protein
VKIPISKILPAKTKGVIRLAIAPKVLFLVLQIRICFIIESITKMINDNNDKINFVCNRTRNEHFACLEQAAKLNFAAVALTTAVKVKVISIFIYYHNYNISISIFAV